MLRAFFISCLLMGLGAKTWAQSIPSGRRIRYREQSLRQYEPFKAEELWKRIAIPPSPALTPAAALEAFRVAPQFRIETVASEPLVSRW